jgi:hypothetical protein
MIEKEVGSWNLLHKKISESDNKTCRKTRTTFENRDVP